MSNRSRAVLRWASAGVLVGAAIAARRMRRREDSDSFTWEGDAPVVDVRGTRLRLPAFYHRVDMFQGMFLASYRAVRDRLPTDELRPVRWVDGRAVLLVSALRYHVISGEYADGTSGLLTPYGEILIAAVVTRGAAAPVVPLVVPPTALGPSAGGFVLHLPVTTLEARDAGRVVYGMPKFVADMDFEEDPGYRRVRLSEGDEEILTLTVRPRGRIAASHKPTILYSVLNGDLIETLVHGYGHAQTGLGGGTGELSFGTHEVADDLRALDVAARPVMTINNLDRRIILPAGRAVGSADDYPGYAGADRDRGRYTVRYPGTDAIDQYGSIPRALPRLAGTG